MPLEDKLQATANESKLEQKLNKKSNLLKIALDTIIYTPLLAASAFTYGAVVTLSTAIPAIGYTIRAWIENK